MSVGLGTRTCVRVQPVDPVAFAEQASRVLGEAFQPPSLCYAPDYLRWQFEYPGASGGSGPRGARTHSASLGVAAFDGDEPIGFIGAIPRRLRRGEHTAEVRLVSFVSVCPRCQGRGLAAVLYDRMLDTLARADVPVVSFAAVGSAGERSLLKAYDRMGFALRPIGVLPICRYLERPSLPSPAVEAVEVSGVDELLETLEVCSDDTTLHVAPDREQLAHYARDPRPRVAVLLRDLDGRPLGGAMVVLAKVTSVQADGPLPGVEDLPIVENVFLIEPSAEALAAVCRFAGRRWSEGGRPRPVSLLSTRTVTDAAVAALGVRKVSSGFTAYVASRDPDHPFLRALGTSLEVV